MHSKPDKLFQVKAHGIGNPEFNFTMNCILPGGFIEWEYSNREGLNQLTVKNTIFDAAKIQITLPLISTPFEAKAINMKKVTLKCMTQANHQLIGMAWQLQCISSCDCGKYRLDGSAAIISMKKNNRGQLKPRFKVEQCVPCPVGADYNSEHPSPLPDYWGYSHKEEGSEWLDVLKTTAILKVNTAIP